jgi:hypothetical protein
MLRDHGIDRCLQQEHPDSDPTLDGPFCGAFFSSNPQTPFIGIVFKVPFLFIFFARSSRLIRAHMA